MSSVLITGCDYGIGFEFARQYAEAGWTVHAVCLQAESEARFEPFGPQVAFHQVDVSDEAAVAGLAASLGDEPVDLLINNAATFAPDGAGALELPDMDEFTRVMRVNAIAPIYVAEALADAVARSEKKLMVFVSTRSGSIGDNGSGGHYAYRCSKTALNMAAKSISIDLRDRGVTAIAIHPGSVQTETRKKGQVDVQTSVAGMRDVIAGLGPEDTGTFQRFDGGTIEW